MGEREVVDRTDAPLTTDRLRADLRELGVTPGKPRSFTRRCRRSGGSPAGFRPSSTRCSGR
ncbi:hypothetical protein ACFQFH_08720 [Halobaculum halobium]|uniref:hypothetical protein n=1 Tax=Halobaculum halobium TaxID=3032281 RepID=UPI00360B87DE